MTRRSVRAAALAVLMGTVALFGPVRGASAQTLPPPAGVAELVDSILNAVGDLLPSLAPEVVFNVDGDAEVFSYGASAQVSGSYACNKVLAVDALLPQLTAQSIVVDVVEAVNA
ncbi:MAG: hypothetical protein QOE93_1001, partial [Actinomycetota bacterium]|nr:hypothetical protein [Actinomycetota bacterium]